MRVIVPMAGLGKRMRPHTLTTPKPLIPVAGKSIVQRLVEYLGEMCEDRIQHIAFVVGDFGKETEKNLLKIAEDLGAEGSIHHQEVPLGTAHAILCAQEHLKEHVIIAFADTLFYADFKVNEDADGVIWVQKVENPQQFGVIKVAPEGHISEFIEKSPVIVSDLAIIGIYYFRDGENLKHELQYLLDNDIKEKGESQLTTALEHMKNKGLKLYPGEVARAEVQLTDNTEEVGRASKLVLPGVGAFGSGMDGLRRHHLPEAIHEAVQRGVPFLGICVGMQLMFSEGHEMGVHQGFDLLAGKVVRFPTPPRPSPWEGECQGGSLKIPHMGWNQLEPAWENPLLDGVQMGDYAYFVHSYYCDPVDATAVLAWTDYGFPFASVVGQDNIYGLQFHPEKSQSVGLTILKNFLENCN